MQKKTDWVWTGIYRAKASPASWRRYRRAASLWQRPSCPPGLPQCPTVSRFPSAIGYQRAPAPASRPRPRCFPYFQGEAKSSDRGAERCAYRRGCEQDGRSYLYIDAPHDSHYQVYTCTGETTEAGVKAAGVSCLAVPKSGMLSFTRL